MSGNKSPLPRPRRSTRPAAPSSGPAPDDVATVHGWLARLAADPAETEQLLVEILRRSRAAPPDCLRVASTATRLQFLTVQAVLRRRGVL